MTGSKPLLTAGVAALIGAALLVRILPVQAQAQAEPPGRPRLQPSLRPAILTLLREQPTGLTRPQIEAALARRGLGDTLQRMVRAAVLVRTGDRYRLAHAAQGGQAEAEAAPRPAPVAQASAPPRPPANAVAAHARGGGHERVCRRQTALDRGASLRTLALSYTPHTPRRRVLLVAVPTPVVWFRLLTLASREGIRVGSNGYNKRLREATGVKRGETVSLMRNESARCYHHRTRKCIPPRKLHREIQ